MRKLFNTLFVIIAAMVTFAGCAKEEVNAPANETKTVQFIAESIESKTAFGTPDGTTYPTLWTANDEEVHVSMNLTSSDAVAVAPSDDFHTARFETSVTDDGTGAYTFYSVSPALACISFNATYKSYNVEIPTVQNPTANSVDEKAQIIVAKSEQFSVLPSSVNLTYSHLTAYGKMTLANLNLDGAVISSVALTASKNFAFRYYYYPESGTTEENGASKTITINTTSASDIWFACAPVDMSNSTMTVVVNTDKGTFTKTITFPADRKFEAGKIAKFSVDMKDISLVAPKVYELVANSADLTEGSQVVIVGGSYAMSTNQKTNNRGTAGVTLSADKKTIATPGSDVQIFTIEAGKQAGTVAFNTGSGYIYAASSGSNHLKTETSLTDNSSWLVTISDGVATIKAQGTNTRNWLRYNSSSSLFSCYSSGQDDVYIYKLQGSGTVLENYLSVSSESIEVDADATSASFTVSSDLQWTAASDNATVTTEGNTVTVKFEANTVKEEKTYTVTVTANGVEPKTVTITQKALATTITVAEFCELNDSDAEYQLTGIITSIYQAYNPQYGNISFRISDGTGEVLIYRLSCEGVTDPANTITVGDEITVLGKKTTYSGSAQMAEGCEIVNHKDACTAPGITCSDNTVTITAEAGATIYYTTDGGEPSTSSDIYESAFEITETVTVKAIAVAEGKVQSAVASKSCTFVDPEAEQPKTEYTYTWTAASGALGTKAQSTVSMNLNNTTWSIARSGSAGYTGWTSNVIQIGKSGAPETLVMKTSDIPGVIKSISVECSSYKANHSVTISVGGVEYISNISTSSWTTVGTVSAEGNSSGEIEIKFAPGSSGRALYIKSLKIVYLN